MKKSSITGETKADFTFFVINEIFNQVSADGNPTF